MKYSTLTSDFIVVSALNFRLLRAVGSKLQRARSAPYGGCAGCGGLLRAAHCSQKRARWARCHTLDANRRYAAMCASSHPLSRCTEGQTARAACVSRRGLRLARCPVETSREFSAQQRETTASPPILRVGRAVELGSGLGHASVRIDLGARLTGGASNARGCAGRGSVHRDVATDGARRVSRTRGDVRGGGIAARSASGAHAIDGRRTGRARVRSGRARWPCGARDGVGGAAEATARARRARAIELSRALHADVGTRGARLELRAGGRPGSCREGSGRAIHAGCIRRRSAGCARGGA